MRQPAALCAVCLLLCAAARTASLREIVLADWSAETIHGAALQAGNAPALITWGGRLLSWDLSHPGKPRILRGALDPPFAAGGCLYDIDQDGRPDLIAQQGGAQGGLGKLVYALAPSFDPVVIDSNTEFRDCLGVTLLGHRGVLVVHRYGQLRFHEVPSHLPGPWPMQEVYSFYTPSQQGGLLQADIDGDPYPDLLCGNYWLRSPARFDLPWRLFAINIYNDRPASAMLRLALARIGGGTDDLVVTESAVTDARLAWFSRPGDPKLLWEPHPITVNPPLQFAAGLAVADLNNDHRPDLFAGERNGRPSRLLAFWNNGQGSFRTELLQTGEPVIQLWPLPSHELLMMGQHRLSRWHFTRE